MKIRILSLVLLFCCADAARAATITVNSTADPAGFNNGITIAQLGGTVTLRDAINATRNSGGTNTITFAPSLAGQTIYLSQGILWPLGPQTNLTLQGLSGSSGVTIARDPSSPRVRLFTCSGSGFSMTVNDLTFANGAPFDSAGEYKGGGFEVSGCTLNLNRCTIMNCDAFQGGGGIHVGNGGSLNATNCTIANNHSYAGGGGIYNEGGAVTLTHTTITGHNIFGNGGGLYTTGGSVLLVNTIIAGNQVTSGTGADIAGAAVSASSHHNLIDDANSSGGLTNGVNGNIVGVNAQLNSLTNNGGPTQTVSLLPNSPALDAGAAGLASTDQRGVSRPLGAGPDIGAYELIPGAPTLFTSDAAATFTIGYSSSFTVTTNSTGVTYLVSGALPSGVSFSGAGVFSGNPSAGTEGAYSLIITATGPNGGSLTQSLTLYVVHPVVVTTAVDEDNGSTDPALGTGTSLREAINYANNISVYTTIVFSPSLAGQSINLTATGDSTSNQPSALAIHKSLAIRGLSGNNGITIRNAKGGTLRLFYIYSAVVSFYDLTFADGNAQFGGAINNTGELHLYRCMFRNNTASVQGGALYSNSGYGFELTNCTLTNNQAQFAGGGIHLGTNAAQMSLTNCTITNNKVNMGTTAGGGAGGLSGYNKTVLINTLVAGNTGPDGGASDVSGTIPVDSSSHHNLIGTGGSNGLVNGVNGNIVGVADAKLASLASNGGPTQTIALLAGSAAIDTGATVAGVTSDERGCPRPIGAAPDIGAFEYIAAPVVSANPLNQAVSLGQTATFNALASNLFNGTAPSVVSDGFLLYPGQYLLSPGNRYQLIYQQDGNLVLKSTFAVLWSSGTAGQTPGVVSMQSDGNLVIYGPGGPQWASNTSGNPHALLALQDDGNLVIYGAVPVFATGTSQNPAFTPDPTTQWQVSTDHGVTFTDIAGANGVNLSLTPSLGDNDNQYRAVFSNPTGTATTSPAKLTILTTLQVWRSLQVLAPDGSQDLLTPANDGVANLLKYAFNMAPNFGDLAKPNVGIMPPGGTAGLPNIYRDGSGHLVIELVRRKASTYTGITYVVETGGDLNNLLPLSLDGASVSSIDATWERVTIADPIVSPKRFGHVRVTVAP